MKQDNDNRNYNKNQPAGNGRGEFSHGRGGSGNRGDRGDRGERGERTNRAGRAGNDAREVRGNRKVPADRGERGERANRYEAKYEHNAPRTTGGESQEERETGLVIGRNAVRELLAGGRTVDKILVRRGDREGSIVVLVAMAVDRGIPVVEVDHEKLDAIAGFAPHQGIVAMTAQKDYVEVEDILRIAEERGEAPLIAIADGITDPYNLGALIRCAEGLGAHGLILPKRRASGLTPLVSKASAGAIEHLAIAKVTNLAQTVQKLQERGVWVYAAEAGGTSYDKVDFSGPCAIVFGSEGDGVSALLKQKSDMIVSIPMRGQVNSLNVSTAAAILLAEAARQHAAKRAASGEGSAEL